MKRREIFLAVTGIILVIGLILSSSNRRKPIEKIGYSMDTQIRMVVYDKDVKEDILEDAYKEMQRLDKMLSNFNESSETTTLNKEGRIKASEDFISILNWGIKVAGETNGAYDLTIYPLTKMWHYKNLYVPTAEEIAEAKKRIDFNNIEIADNEVALKNFAEIDVSSIAKGYIADKILSFLEERGVKNALVDAGGNIKVAGSPYRDKSEGFVIGIQDPLKSIGIPLGQLKVNDMSVVTSGIYERNFKIDNKTYHHIIDPKTGYPADNDILSVSVISKDSVCADAYATALVVMGSEEALKFTNKNSLIECIIIRNDNKVLLSDGIKDFVLTSDEYKLAEEQ